MLEDVESVLGHSVVIFYNENHQQPFWTTYTVLLEEIEITVPICTIHGLWVKLEIQICEQITPKNYGESIGSYGGMERKGQGHIRAKPDNLSPSWTLVVLGHLEGSSISDLAVLWKETFNLSET